MTRTSLAQALKKKGTPASDREATQEVPGRAPSRRGRKAVTVYVNAEAHKQLRLLSVELDQSVQALGVEAWNMLFAQHGKAQIAE